MVRDDISVNALAFAAIDIPGSMTRRYLDEQKVPKEALMQAFPVGRMGRPEELVAAAMYLCFDEARFCTGTTLVLDGGFTAQQRVPATGPGTPGSRTNRSRRGPDSNRWPAPRQDPGAIFPMRFECCGSSSQSSVLDESESAQRPAAAEADRSFGASWSRAARFGDPFDNAGLRVQDEHEPQALG
ncbi:MAG: SDR family oxidoreductase, partial [Candidatus Rokuibacteriota bacterium]